MSASMSSEFARAMLPVAIEILGEPNEGLSSKTEKRFGSRGALSVDLVKGTWCDHADGDRGGGVLDFLHVKKGLAKPDALDWLRERRHLPPAAKRPGTRPKFVCAYDYTDAAGALLFQVVRFSEPKDFRQRRPDPAAPGAWIWKTAGLQLVLYRLPEVIAAVAAGRTIYVAEGEKGADALRKLGVAATCSPGGAGKWKPHYSAPLAGADVVLLPDNDDPGREHVAKVGKALQGIARRVRVLPLPGLPDKGDVADWIASGGTRKAIEALAASAASLGATEAEPSQTGEPAPAPDRLVFIKPHTLQGVPVPPREWIVEDWLPAGCATLLYGDGGTGKTLLAQQLMTSCATGKPWIGLAVTRCRSLALFCEDDPAELHRRQDRINSALGIEFDDLDDLTWASGVGRDNALMRFLQDGRPSRTDLFAEIKQAAIAFQARLLIIDTAADTFGGNENDRAEVRNFMGAMNALAMDLGGAVLVNAHPSRSGLSAGGDMDGGSTAWSNTARSRWSLARPKAEGDEEADTDERVLTRRKANYAAMGTELRLRWDNGALRPKARATGLVAMAQDAEAEAVFMALLAKTSIENRPVSDSPNAGNSAPKMFARRADRQGFTKKDFEAAMQRLFTNGKIRMEDYGRPNGRGQPRRIAAIEGRSDA